LLEASNQTNSILIKLKKQKFKPMPLNTIHSDFSSYASYSHSYSLKEKKKKISLSPWSLCYFWS